MKQKFLLAFILVVPMVLCAQQDRKGWYASVGVGYGSYELDLYNYNSGSGVYADQKFTQPVIWLGFEKKSFWQKENIVLDAGATLTGGFGLKLDGASSSGWSLGLDGLAKAGYLLGDEKTIVPLVGLGPYFMSLQSGGGDDGFSNQIFGLQGYAGVDFRASRFTVTPQLRFSIVGWGTTNRYIGSADNDIYAPGMFEIGIKAALHL
ncbi:MAG: hypothetical protein QM610_09815 [Chitinophagaceae bacterium]